MKVQPTVKSTSATAKGERARIKKDLIENELVAQCDKALAKLVAYSERKLRRAAMRKSA